MVICTTRSPEGAWLLLRTEVSIFETRRRDQQQPPPGEENLSGNAVATLNTSQPGGTFVVRTRSAAYLVPLARPRGGTPRRFLWVLGETLALAAFLFTWACPYGGRSRPRPP